MKKSSILTSAIVSLLLLCTATLHAQYSIQQIPYTPYPYNEGVMFNVPDDQYSTVLPVGFNFTFFGNTYSSLVVSSNGYITFDTATQNLYSPWPITDSLPEAVPDTLGAVSVNPLNAIMGPWEDIYNPAGGAIYYANYGVAPNRVLVLSYDSIPFFLPSNCPGSYYTGQIVLHESSNVIDVFIMHKDSCTGWNGSAAIEGIINGDGTVAYIVPGRNFPNVWTAYNDAYRFQTCPSTANPVDTIRGRVYADLNHNCTFDGADYGLAQQVVTAGCATAYTDNNGFYTLTVDTGSYTVTHGLSGYTQPECPAGSSYSVYFSAVGMTQSNTDFADTLEGNCTDVSLAIGTWTMARCVGDQYTAYYCNNGAVTTMPLQLTVTMPDSVYITNSDVAPASVVGNTYTFNLAPLNAGACGFFHFTDSVDCNLALGEYKCLGASISGTPDCDTTNNYATDCHQVVAAYDPNAMVVASNSINYVNGETISNNDSLTYQISFQNTGTAAAQNIVVTDSLPATLNFNTVASSIASSPYTFTNNNGMLTWTFSNIYLPDSSMSQTLSHGFIRFKVKQQPGNAPATLIPNQAAIYFDSNPAVQTNIATDTIATNTSVANITSSNLVIYPNPAHDAIHIQYTGNAAKAVLTVYNELGASMQTLILPGNGTTIDTKSWAKGIYLLRITTNGQAAITRSVAID